MPTSNLRSKTLGDILIQSGQGTPDHIASKGSFYTNETTGIIHSNLDGISGWTSLNTVSFGDMYILANATQTTISSTNVWVPTTGLTWTAGSNNGFLVSGGKLVTGTGRGGRYEIFCNATLAVVGTGNYEVGVSKNGATPVSGAYNGCSVLSTVPTAGITISASVSLVAGDTVELAVRNVLNTNNIIVKHASIFLTRIGD